MMLFIPHSASGCHGPPSSRCGHVPALIHAGPGEGLSSPPLHVSHPTRPARTLPLQRAVPVQATRSHLPPCHPTRSESNAYTRLSSQCLSLRNLSLCPRVRGHSLTSPCSRPGPQEADQYVRQGPFLETVTNNSWTVLLGVEIVSATWSGFYRIRIY